MKEEHFVKFLVTKYYLAYCFDVGRFKFLFKFQDGDFVLVVF